MKKRSTKSSGEILKNISRLAAEAKWTEQELNEALIEVGIDPDRLVSQVLAEANQFLNEYQEHPEDNYAAKQVAAASQTNSAGESCEGHPSKVKKTSGRKSSGSTLSLMALCKKRAINYFDLPHVLELSTALVTKLSLRLLKFSSIPQQIIQKIAEAINVDVKEVVRCLQGEPLMVEGARFKATTAPEIPEQQDFFDAVQKDRSLSPERKQQLMSLKDKEQKCELEVSKRRVA